MLGGYVIELLKQQHNTPTTQQHMFITIFGNQDLAIDSSVVLALPELQKIFPQISFLHQDPTENLTVPKDRWIIVDVAQGIDQIHVFRSLDQFTESKSLTAHDYDLYTDLKLMQKTRTLPPLVIIAVPIFYKKSDVVEKLPAVLRACLKSH